MNKQRIIVSLLLIIILIICGCTENTSDNNKTNGDNNDEDSSPFDQNESNIPNYPESITGSIPNDLKTHFKIPVHVDCTGLITPDDPTIVLQWYEEHMSPWTLIDEATSVPPDQPDNTMYTQYYKNNTDGVFLFVLDNFMGEQTLIGIVEGSWSTVQTYGFNETANGGQQGNSNQNEDVDWTNAYTISDPANDFWLGGGSPPEIINFPPSDILSISLKCDDTNLYIKFEMNGNIPTLPLTEGNDIVRMLVMDVIFDTDHNPSTGQVMNFNGGELAVEAWFGSPPQAQGVMYTFFHYAFYDVAGDEGVGTWHDASLMNGGEGESFVTISCPLTDINLESGQNVNAIFFAEVESDMYHHYARDVINNDQWVGPITI